LRDAADVADNAMLVESWYVAIKGWVSVPARQPGVALPDVRNDGWSFATEEAGDLVVAVRKALRLHLYLRLSYRLTTAFM
jgi:hypothetical protein